MNKMDEDYKADNEELESQQQIEKINLDVKLESLKNEEERKEQQRKAEEEKTKRDYDEALKKQKDEAAVNFKSLEGKCDKSLGRLRDEYEQERQSRETHRIEEQVRIQAERDRIFKAQLARLEQKEERKRREDGERQISLAQSLSMNEWINNAVIHVSNVSNYINLEDYSTALTKMESASQAVSALTQYPHLAKAELNSRTNFGVT
ncbi:hypothetical protein WR25_15799 [Diploscapter pachys]|uniref:Uncharacterized protein n=1 Tax=Diploscapter pachys TaxID=2018661 RepID=A0A2A2M312_9BILA|nr:hypothetical protein WR25_15799 [Diploscapter pachys]